MAKIRMTEEAFIEKSMRMIDRVLSAESAEQLAEELGEMQRGLELALSDAVECEQQLVLVDTSDYTAQVTAIFNAKASMLASVTIERMMQYAAAIMQTKHGARCPNIQLVDSRIADLQMQIKIMRLAIEVAEALLASAVHE